MATGTYTLLDIAARSGVGVTSLIEGVLTYAPELRVLPVFPKAGITYTTLTRTELPAGDFAKVGAGVKPTKSVWKRESGSMAKFEAQMKIGEDIVIAERSENPDLVTGDILADEAIATVRGSVIKLGSQVWYGTNISADGFKGLSTQVDTTNNEGDAGGSGSADSSSVYLLYLDDTVSNPQGVHMFLGNGGRMSMSPVWIKQQVPDPNDSSKLMMAFVNNFLAYLGLVVARPQAVYRVKNVTSSNPFTDSVAADLLAKVPLALLADKSKFRWFMNGPTRTYLQKSRATVTVASPDNKGLSAGGVFPDVPTSCQDILIQPTDSLRTTDRAGLYH